MTNGMKHYNINRAQVQALRENLAIEKGTGHYVAPGIRLVVVPFTGIYHLYAYSKETIARYGVNL